MHQPPEVVGERQEEEHEVSLDRDVVELVDDGDHRVVVAVPDHAALRWAGRARGVDVREEVVLGDGVCGLVDRRGVARPVRAAAGEQIGEVGERERVLETELRHLC